MWTFLNSTTIWSLYWSWRWGVLGSTPLHAGTPLPPPGTRGRYPPPGSRHPPPHQDQRQVSPRSRHTPRHSACLEILATRRWYASYWNAILFFLLLHWNWIFKLYFLWCSLFWCATQFQQNEHTPGNGTGTIGNNGSWFLSPSFTNVDIYKWYCTSIWALYWS